MTLEVIATRRKGMIKPFITMCMVGLTNVPFLYFSNLHFVMKCIGRFLSFLCSMPEFEHSPVYKEAIFILSSLAPLAVPELVSSARAIILPVIMGVARPFLPSLMVERHKVAEELFSLPPVDLSRQSKASTVTTAVGGASGTTSEGGFAVSSGTSAGGGGDGGGSDSDSEAGEGEDVHAHGDASTTATVGSGSGPIPFFSDQVATVCVLTQ